MLSNERSQENRSQKSPRSSEGMVEQASCPYRGASTLTWHRDWPPAGLSSVGAGQVALSDKSLLSPEGKGQRSRQTMRKSAESNSHASESAFQSYYLNYT